MYGDSQVIRRRAGQLRDQATDLRALADRLAGQADALRWSGRAAEGMRERMHDRAAQLRAAAAAHETAADALARHAGEVESVLDAIADAERRFHAAADDARGRVARLAAQEGEVRVSAAPEDEALLAFTPPPPGHLDWVTTDIPGR